MVSPVTFLKETQDELKKVVWPTRKTVIRLTIIVISISIIVALYIGLLDMIFQKAIEVVIK